jgi:hypothetical protein
MELIELFTNICGSLNEKDSHIITLPMIHYYLDVLTTYLGLPKNREVAKQETLLHSTRLSGNSWFSQSVTDF